MIVLIVNELSSMLDPLYSCYMTIRSMMRDRKYLIEDEILDENTFVQTYLELDLEFKKRDSDEKVNVFFIESSKKTPNLGKKDITDTFIPKMKKKNITHMILVLKDMKVTPSAKSEINSYKPNYLVEYFDWSDLIVNITEHVKVPKHIPLSQQEKEIILKKHKATGELMPKISDYDKVAKYLGLQAGDMVEIIRISESKGIYKYYRICVSGLPQPEYQLQIN
jgi:DNA-directed RNA polymerases I, II, and III subunit RPABC1